MRDKELSVRDLCAGVQDSLGKEFNVLFENDIEDGMMHGFTANYIRVSAKYDPVFVNEIKHVRLAGINERGFVEVDEVEAATVEGA